MPRKIYSVRDAISIIQVFKTMNSFEKTHSEITRLSDLLNDPVLNTASKAAIARQLVHSVGMHIEYCSVLQEELLAYAFSPSPAEPRVILSETAHQQEPPKILTIETHAIVSDNQPTEIPVTPAKLPVPPVTKITPLVTRPTGLGNLALGTGLTEFLPRAKTLA